MDLWLRLKSAFRTFRYYSQVTSIHGLLHMFQSNSLPRQVFWLIFGTFCFCVGLCHLVSTIYKFKNPPLIAQLKVRHELTSFPLVTLCRLKPVSETLFLQRCVGDYITNSWDYFSSWLVKKKDTILAEATQENFEKLTKTIVLLYQIAWVSADTRDLGLFDDTMLLSCKYNGVECTHEHFKLLQNSHYWNCYTFDYRLVNNTAAMRGRFDQLDMILFTDLYGYNDGHGGNAATYNQCLEQLIANRSATSEKDFYTCLRYICPNSILQFQNFDPASIRIFFHKSNEYPFSRRDFMDVKSGRTSTITLNPLHRKLESKGDNICHQGPFEQVKYMRYFGVKLNDTAHWLYNKTHINFVFEAKQDYVYKTCHCYSHRYPYDSSMRSKLCFYVPPEQWRSLPDALKRSIKCHEEAADTIDHKTTQIAQKYRQYRPCNHMRYRPMMYSLSWPKFEYIPIIWEDLVVPKLVSAKQFTQVDTMQHHIYKPDCMNSSIYQSREDYQYLSLVASNEKCYDYLAKNKNLNSTILSRLGWCIRPKEMTENLAQVRIKLQYARSDVYEETASFDWTEALSEIGGTMGLYIGVSLISAVEMLEMLVAVIVSFTKEKRQRLHNRK